MFQILTFDSPIPSCEIHSLHWDKSEHRWYYGYAVQTPFEITNGNKTQLMVYEHISDLNVKVFKDQHPESVNILFHTLDEYLGLLEAQRLTDLWFREQWKKKHPDAKVRSASRYRLEHRDWSYEELAEKGLKMVAFVIQEDVDGQDMTEFAGS